jgi:hypothetical protein
MKYTRRLLIALLTFIIGVFSAAIWSAHLGKRVWSPRVFAWRNPLRQPPRIELQADCPLLITNPRYYSFVSIGSAVGGVLNFDITNTSNKLVHSYDCRYYSPVPVGNGSYGTQPDEGLLPGQLDHGSISAHEYAPLSVTIDFVQFADGTTWLDSSPHSTIKPEGLRAGAKAAATYLLDVMNRDGVQTVMAMLPRIHAEVREPNAAANYPEFGIFGFYAGVTNTTVRLEHEYKDGGAERVETFLRSYQK